MPSCLRQTKGDVEDLKSGVGPIRRHVRDFCYNLDLNIRDIYRPRNICLGIRGA